MEFLLYLSPEGRDIYNIISKKIRIIENAPICKKYDIYGWYQSDKKTMVFCTDRIISRGNAKYYINETLHHESVHVAQSCKGLFGGIEPLGISLSSMPLSDHRKADLNKAISQIGSNIKNIEHEAFWMEDKPNMVKYVIKKYCF